MTERDDRLPRGMTPRCLLKEQAAAYCGMTPDAFESRVRPYVPPLPLGSRPLLWDVRALDRWLDEQSGLVEAFRPADAWLAEIRNDDRARKRR